MIKYYIENSIKHLKIYNEVGEVFISVEKKKRLTHNKLIFKNETDDVILIVKDYSFFIFSSFKIIFNNTGYSKIYKDNKIIIIENRIIDLKLSSFNFKNWKYDLFIDNLKIGGLESIIMTLAKDLYQLTFNEDSNDNYICILALGVYLEFN